MLFVLGTSEYSRKMILRCAAFAQCNKRAMDVDARSALANWGFYILIADFYWAYESKLQ